MGQFIGVEILGDMRIRMRNDETVEEFCDLIRHDDLRLPMDVYEVRKEENATFYLELKSEHLREHLPPLMRAVGEFYYGNVSKELEEAIADMELLKDYTWQNIRKWMEDHNGFYVDACGVFPAGGPWTWYESHGLVLATTYKAYIEYENQVLTKYGHLLKDKFQSYKLGGTLWVDVMC